MDVNNSLKWNASLTEDQSIRNLSVLIDSSTLPSATSSISSMLSTPKPQVPMSDADWFFLFSEDQLTVARRIQEPLKYIFIALAVPLALANIVVFSLKRMRSASGIYVIALNAGQLVYVVANTVDDVWGSFDKNPYSGSTVFCGYNLYIAIYLGLYLSKRGSYVILCLATIERLYAVLRPLHIKNFFLSKRPVLCVVVAYSVVAILHISNLLMFDVVMMTVAAGQMACRILLSDLYKSYSAQFLTFHLVLKIIFDYATIIIQLIVNILIAWALRRHNMTTKHLKSSADEDTKRRQERQLTVTLLGAAVCYLAFAFPAAIFSLLASTVTDFKQFGKYAFSYAFALDFIFNVSILGVGVDFFCFLALSSKFRKVIFRAIRCKERRSLVSTADQTTHEDVSLSEVCDKDQL